MFAKSLISIVSLLAVVLPSVDAYATTGCYALAGLTSVLADATSSRTGGILSIQSCVTTTQNLGRQYAYYDATLRNCYSTNVAPLLAGTTNTVTSIVVGGTGVCSAGQLQGFDVNTPFTDFGCATVTNTVTPNGGVIALPNILTISACLDACENLGFKYAIATYVVAASVCTCAPTLTLTARSSCGLLSNYVYINNNPVPSSLRKRTVDSQKRTVVPSLCPGKLQSCRVNQRELESDDYECIDTQSELESCGGCTEGVLDGDISLATSGVDCSAIAGVELGAVSCIRGQCQVLKCKRGYQLIDNACVSTRSVASLALKTLRLQNL